MRTQGERSQRGIERAQQAAGTEYKKLEESLLLSKEMEIEVE